MEVKMVSTHFPRLFRFGCWVPLGDSARQNMQMGTDALFTQGSASILMRLFHCHRKTFEKIKHFFGTSGTLKREGSLKSRNQLFARGQYFPYRENKGRKWTPFFPGTFQSNFTSGVQRKQQMNRLRNIFPGFLKMRQEIQAFPKVIRKQPRSFCNDLNMNAFRSDRIPRHVCSLYC